MLIATFLALGAAVLHAAWNLSVKQAGDRFIAMWGQFLIAGVVGGFLLLAFPALRELSWRHAFASGLTHVVYTMGLAAAYGAGDFALTYPLARGGGAVLAALGGAVVLHDGLTPLGWVGVFVIGTGLVLITRPSWGTGDRAAVGYAALVACTIGTYTVIDTVGSRRSGGSGYVLGSFVTTALTLSVTGVARGRTADLGAALRVGWRRLGAGGLASMATYAMVLAAVRHAPVGYVAAIRECSVVLAALAGVRLLGEGHARARVTAACVVAVGLLVLVVGR